MVLIEVAKRRVISVAVHVEKIEISTFIKKVCENQNKFNTFFAVECIHKNSIVILTAQHRHNVP